MGRVKGYNKGFTLVELLAVIVIIGILLAVSVTAVIHFIDRAKVEQRKNQEKTMAMAAENYLQENRGQLPKNIGETTTIPISVLKNNKYITEDIKDGNGKSCMVNSYVTVYKESKTKYVYKGHLYCGDEEVPATVEKAKPTIKIDFADAEGNSIKNDSSVLEKVAEARFIIEFGGGKKDDKKIAIDGYSYSVLARVQGESSLKEVYSSGTLSANHATEITVNRDNNLKDYIDISKETTVAIKATVRNVDGGINDKVEFIGESGGQAEVVYHDTKAPTCVTDQTKGEASENDWININSSNKERKITVVCKDGGGSGCIRSTFTKTWLNNESHEFDNITIKDNAGNTKNCKVRVNIDVGYPIINIDAFAVNNTDPSNSILTGSKTTENSPNGIARINSGEYRNLVNGYMGNSKYPNGVIYKVTLKDNISLKNWKWEVNNKGIKTTTASNYETIGNIEEAKSGSCLDKNECSFNITFKNDGLRKGKLTVYDKAGNKAKYTIYANIDREGPTAPTIINSSTGNSTGKWVKNNVTLNLKSTDSLSGIGDYYYTYKSDATAFGSDATKQWVKLAGGSGKNNFTTMPWTDEMNKKVYVKACDVVGNCSSSSNTKIMIDKTAPTGMRVVGYKKNSNVDITSATGLSTIGSDIWHKGWEIVVADNATDNSGVGEVYYKVTVTGASTNVTDEVKSYKNVNAEGISIISFKSCDKLGNCSTATSFRAKLDRTPPTQTSINNSTGGNWTKDSVTLTIGSSDSLSGMGEYYYTYNASANTYGPNEAIQWVNLAGGSEKTSFTPAAWTTEKNQQVYIESCDKVGNCSEKSSTWIRIDKTAPTVPEIINPTGGNWTSGNITLTFNSSDSLSGLKNYQYTYSGDTSVVGDNADNQWVVAAGGNNANSVNNEFAAERNQLVYVRACDNVDNCSDKSSTYIRIDKSNPTCSVTKTETERQSGVTVRITCSDSGSGCATGTRTKTITSDQTYYVSDNVGHTGSCSVSVTSYSQCGACLRNTVYSAVGCYAMSGNVHHWTSCATPSCGKTSVCKNEQYSSAMGCCYYNCNCKTYYK